MQMGPWGKWPLANSRHLGRLAPGQIGAGANGHRSKKALGVNGTEKHQGI